MQHIVFAEFILGEGKEKLLQGEAACVLHLRA